MKPLAPPPRRREAELMDDDALPRREVDRALADLERVNRWLLGVGPMLRLLLPRIVRGGGRQMVVDLGTGSGQVPACLARAARRRGAEIAVVGVDRKLSHLLAGRRRGHPQWRVVADATALPFADAAADWATSNLFFHHFDDDANASIAGEMERIARRGIVVLDLRRSRLAGWLFPLAAAVLGLGRVATLDGRASLRAAWTIEEVDAWCRRRPAAAAQRVEVRRRFPFRWSLLTTRDAQRDPRGRERP